MALTVSYECDKALRLIELLADNLYDFKVCLLIVSTYVVNLSYTSVVDDKIDCLTVILYIEPVTHVLACSVYREWLIIKCICNHKWDKLLREMVWSVVV